MDNIAIIGGSGAMGRAFTQQLALRYPHAMLHTFARTAPQPSGSNVRGYRINYQNEASIEAAASIACADAPLDMVIVTTGILHDDGLMPEKSLRDISAVNLHRLFEANTMTPALVAKYFLPQLHKKRRAMFAALSARVGSISDNRLGGWYAYRASKAALNMVIKNAAIEVARQNKQAIVVGLHPGTVDSPLSAPFQGNVAKGKLFSPAFSAQQLLDVMAELTPAQSGRCFAWDGNEVFP